MPNTNCVAKCSSSDSLLLILGELLVLLLDYNQVKAKDWMFMGSLKDLRGIREA